jgi:hypothetical protein
MGKKRLIVEVDETQHRKLLEEARSKDLTLSNYVRSALHLPLERQGVKSDSPLINRRKKNSSKSA